MTGLLVDMAILPATSTSDSPAGSTTGRVLTVKSRLYALRILPIPSSPPPTSLLSKRRKGPLNIYHLRPSRQGLRDLLLPVEAVLAVDLEADGVVLGQVEQGGADDVLVAHDGLVVVDVRGAVGAVVAVDGFACCGGRGEG